VECRSVVDGTEPGNDGGLYRYLRTTVGAVVRWRRCILLHGYEGGWAPTADRRRETIAIPTTPSQRIYGVGKSRHGRSLSTMTRFDRHLRSVRLGCSEMAKGNTRTGRRSETTPRWGEGDQLGNSSGLSSAVATTSVP
jgi:hypothetical protein